jgi:hypothetical protein
MAGEVMYPNLKPTQLPINVYLGVGFLRASGPWAHAKLQSEAAETVTAYPRLPGCISLRHATDGGQPFSQKFIFVYLRTQIFYS